jgi:hypothetical protein
MTDRADATAFEAVGTARPGHCIEGGVNMDEEIILRVIKQVLADPRLQTLFQEQPSAAARPELLVLLNYAPDLSGVLSEVLGRWGGSHTLKVLATDTVMGHKPVLPAGMTWVTSQEAFKGCWQRMVLPTCSANTLAKIALGLRDNPASAMAAEGICRGIPVELHTEYLGFTEATPASYRQLYQDYLTRVAGYGVILRGPEQGGDHIMAVPGQQPVLAVPVEKAVEKTAVRTVDWTKRLLTEKDVLTFPTDCVIRLGKSAIISPLAKDMLVRRRVETLMDGDVRS